MVVALAKREGLPLLVTGATVVQFCTVSLLKVLSEGTLRCLAGFYP